MQQKAVVLGLIALFLTTSISSFAASGEKAKVKGMIISRTGETLLVKSSDDKVTVVLDDESRTIDKTGLFGLGKKEFSNAVLMPGLKVDIKGVSDAQGRVVARTIVVDGDDLRLQGGHPGR